MNVSHRLPHPAGDGEGGSTHTSDTGAILPARGHSGSRAQWVSGAVLPLQAGVWKGDGNLA